MADSTRIFERVTLGILLRHVGGICRFVFKLISDLRLLTSGFCALLFAFSVSAEAQQTGKIPKIGLLGGGPASLPWHSSFKQEFQKLGYIDGKNVTFIYRFADTNYDLLPTLADELVRLNVDVIITPGSNDTRAAKNATKTIPIVFLGAGSDPVALGLVESLARPGGNLTGVSSIASELAGKRLELLKETVPKLSRVAVLWNPQNTGSSQVWRQSQNPAKGTAFGTSFDGDKHCRRIGEGVQRSTQGA